MSATWRSKRSNGRLEPLFDFNGTGGSDPFRHQPAQAKAACIAKRERPVLVAPATGAAINADSTIQKVTPGRMLMSMGAGRATRLTGTRTGATDKAI